MTVVLDAHSRGRVHRATDRSASLRLPGLPDSVSRARHFTRQVLLGWQLAVAADDCAMVVSELLGNAIRHALPDARIARTTCPLGMTLLRRSNGVLCAVADPSARPPVLHEAGQLAESGRGLHIVDSLALSWGWTLPADGSGKSVWALLPAHNHGAGHSS